MRIGVPKETADGERRVALVPEVVRKLTGGGHEVVVEAGAGEQALLPDSLYTDAGAQIGDPYGADVVVRVAVPSEDEVAKLRDGQILIGFLAPLTRPELKDRLRAAGVQALAMEAIPRISRAQSMDALSSQANVGGYKAALLGAEHSTRFYPMLMTAAGTIPPAKVLVLGAGVAGLQAIATARRLGAVVEAFDVRKAVKEQVQSLGAKFVEVEGMADAQTAGGYAKEITEEEKQKQADAVKRHIAKSDVCITTALIPGRRAPILITAEMVRGMRPGSVIVDLAAEQGGNCELCKPGQTVVENGVTIIGTTNLQSKVAVDASQMYSRNMEKLIVHMLGDGALKIDLGEEITKGCVITHGGDVVHAKVAEVVTAKGAA